MAASTSAQKAGGSGGHGDMRTVIWTDRKGYKHRSLIKDDQPDSEAPMGIVQDPPDLHEVDWEAVIKSLHNSFVETGVTSWLELQRKQNLQNVIFRCVKPRIIALFRSMEG